MKRTHTTMMLAAGAIALSGVGITTATATSGAHNMRAVEASTEIVRGTIESVDLTKNEFTLVVAEPGALQDEKKVTITVNDETTYTLNGQPSTKADALKVDHQAMVVHEARTAVRVDVRTPPSEG
jgi:hypothetical protein